MTEIKGLDILAVDGGAQETLFYARIARILAALGVAATTPFVIYHALHGSMVVAGIASLLVLLQAGLFFLLRNPRFGLVGIYILALGHTTAAVLAALQLGITASYWVFATTVANYYILPLRSAVVFNALSLLLVSPLLAHDPAMGTRFLVNLLLVNLFGYVFSRRSEDHREALRSLLYQDTLTGIGNRRAMDHEIEAAHSLRQRHDMPVSLMVLDLDHFKRVNDRHGHQVGDEVLNQLVNAIQKRLRINDRLFRFGGEEFVLIARGTGLEGARVLAEDIRRVVAESVVEPIEGLTVSIGVAELLAEESQAEWLRRADKALFRAKNAGRNRVELSAC